MSEIKDFVKSLKGTPVLVYGMGKSGCAIVSALHKAGASLIIGDDNPDNLKKFAKYENIKLLDIEVQDFSAPAFLILSPGIPLTHPRPHDIVLKAQKCALEILCDIELFFRIHPSLKTIGVTGTNGKSTTVSLLSHILNEAGTKNALGGNIGTAVFDLKVEGKVGLKWVVLELSSYQIDLCPSFRPDISVILNITPDHIDRHGSIEHYAEVKERLCEPKKGDNPGVAVICSDDEYTQKILDNVRKAALREVVEVSAYKTLDKEKLSKFDTLKGTHNHQNIVCAYAVARKIGLTPEEIWNGVESFPGLNHRQYMMRTINSISYVNDSKATNAASTAMALCSHNNIYWIVGGRKKKTGLDGLEKFFDHINHAFLIGESTKEFSAWFDTYGIKHSRCYTMENAVGQAHAMAQAHRGKPVGTGVVLLSPACASFDQYESFEKRGEHFSQLVDALKED